MRNTKQRDLILNIINSSYNHLTAEEVYEIARKEISNISLGTVYRNLIVLTNLRKIRKIKTFDGKDHYDRMHRHNHFICLKCNKIFDLNDNSFLHNNKDVPKDFEVVGCDITYSGYCNECKKGR